MISIFLLLTVSRASAQESLIVRLADDAPPALQRALEGEGVAKQDMDVLFADVMESHAILPVGTSEKAETIPFRAYTLQIASSASVASVQARWGAQPGVAYAQPNHKYQLDVAALPDDPHLDSLAHLPVINALAAWNVTTGHSDVRIGLVDTGLYFEHPDLQGQVWINPGEDLNGNGRADPSDFNGTDDDGNGFVDDVHGYDFVDRTIAVEPGDLLVRDPDPSEDGEDGGGRGHGTLVAGILAARQDNTEGISGVAPGCRIVPLRAFGADGIGEDDDVAAAIVYAAQMGVDVLNLSFGDVFYSPLMREAIQFAVAQGTTVIASAGNLGGDDPHYPSDYPEVISVAWLTEDGESLAGRATYGIGLDLGAPGSSIYTTLMPRPNEDGAIDPVDLYGRRSGSSTAAPMVTGAAALLRSVDPALTPAAIQAILTATARDIRDPGWDHYTAAGLLNIEAALLRSLPARVELTSPDHDSGWAVDEVPIVGTVLDPAFDQYEIFYAHGDEEVAGAWTSITGPVTERRLDETLGVWQTEGLPEGAYTLRLSVTLRTGRTIEDRRRVYLDRSPPVITVHIFDDGLVGGAYGLAADVETDDLIDVTLRVVRGGNAIETVSSDRRSRRHGLVWADEGGRGGIIQAEITATNVAELSSTVQQSFNLQPRRDNSAFFDVTPLDVPHGYLLPEATDYDRDGLKEIVFNQYQDGWIGDTLAVYEWDGATFAPAQRLIANVIPRDAGDTDGDGLLELLTQVAGATLLIEQDHEQAFPAVEAFIDTTGLANPFDPNAAFGARLADLDRDGRGEILVHNTRQWRVLEASGTTYVDVLRLDNPTRVTDSEVSENEFQQPLVLIDDFDGDEQSDLLAGDGDGDWIMYEFRGNDAAEVAWTHETTRYNAGARFGKGDFDGDGLPEFVTYTQNWTQPTSDDVREPDIGLYYLWKNQADDGYVLVDSFPIPGVLSRHTSMQAADFDGDGRDELVIVNAPDLYVLTFDASLRWSMLFHSRPGDGLEPSGARSVAMVTADFDEDGTPELLAAHADGRFHRYIVDSHAVGNPPPVWVDATARDASTIALGWQPLGADSVTVFRGRPGEALDPVATTTADSLIHLTPDMYRYLLQGWQQGQQTPLSEARVVRPHAPAVVETVVYPNPTTIELVFSEPIDARVRAQQFALDDGGTPKSLLLGRSGTSVILAFEAIATRTDVLRWDDVRDAEGTPAGQESVAVVFPEAAGAEFFISGWTLLDAYTLDLEFSEALDPASAGDAAHYSVHPAGQVVAVAWSPDRPAHVVVEIDGRPVGATGLETSLRVKELRSASGARLAQEGGVVLLTQAAEALTDVYVFPNPYRDGEHQPRIIIAGLTPEATVDILSAQGQLVRRLEERDGDGGMAWDLANTRGEPVPSGVYLIRVEAPDQKPVLRKAAIIR